VAAVAAVVVVVAVVAAVAAAARVVPEPKVARHSCRRPDGLDNRYLHSP
jgi:hypothetical protein